MPTSTSDLLAARAVDVKVTDDELTVQLEDGRTLAVPLVWYPRLLHGSKRARRMLDDAVTYVAQHSRPRLSAC